MQKLVLTFGLIAGAIIVALGYATRPLWMGDDGQWDMKTGEILGYVSMIVALSMIFFGIRSYRDKHLAGTITFGKAFQVGILITLVASVIYVAGWMIYYQTSDAARNFPEQYLNYLIEHMKEEGKAQSEIDAEVSKFEQNMEMYKNPIVRIGITLMEIFPVGLIITLLSSFILKRNPSL